MRHTQMAHHHSNQCQLLQIDSQERLGRNLRSLLLLIEIQSMKPQTLKEFAIVLEGNNKHLNI